jgi:hypothetical protein
MDRMSPLIILASSLKQTHPRGIYDTSYLSYLRSVLSLFPQFGLTAVVALHQDVWSRYSGGSRAPAWTLELAGFDLYGLEDCDTAWLQAAGRTWWWTLGGRARSMAMRISETRSGDNGVGWRCSLRCSACMMAFRYNVSYKPHLVV